VTVHPRLGDQHPYSAVRSHRENMIHQESTLCMAHDGVICADACSLESCWVEWHGVEAEPKDFTAAFETRTRDGPLAWTHTEVTDVLK
jgi:hypothetical protein